MDTKNQQENKKQNKHNQKNVPIDEVLLEDNETLYTLADEIHSYPNKTTVIPFLVTKGTHFVDIQKDVQTQQESGLDIRLEETLLARTDIQYELLTQQDLNPDLQ